MEDYREVLETGKQSAEKAAAAARGEAANLAESAGKRTAALGEEAARQMQSLWEETKNRTRKATERLGEEWEKVSSTAETYTREHSIGVALGALGVGVLLGLLVGISIRRD